MNEGTLSKTNYMEEKKIIAINEETGERIELIELVNEPNE